MAGIVTIQCIQTGESLDQQLVEGGLLDWKTVERAFQADLVELEAAGPPPLYHAGDRTGLTRNSFQANDIIRVKVTKKGEPKWLWWVVLPQAGDTRRRNFTVMFSYDCHSVFSLVNMSWPKKHSQ